MTRSLPPSQAHGIAVATSASGYQWGPKAGPRFHVTTSVRNQRELQHSTSEVPGGLMIVIELNFRK